MNYNNINNNRDNNTDYPDRVIENNGFDVFGNYNVKWNPNGPSPHNPEWSQSQFQFTQFQFNQNPVSFNPFGERELNNYNNLNKADVNLNEVNVNLNEVDVREQGEILKQIQIKNDEIISQELASQEKLEQIANDEIISKEDPNEQREILEKIENENSNKLTFRNIFLAGGFLLLAVLVAQNLPILAIISKLLFGL